VQISGKRLFFPRNFRFLERLPARFDLTVIKRGVSGPKETGSAYEVRVMGQPLVIRSKVELKEGARYELEKKGPLEFSIISEKAQETIQKADAPEKTTLPSGDLLLPQLPLPERFALKIVEDDQNISKISSGKYLFDWNHEFGLRGLFVERGAKEYILFLTGHSAKAREVEQYGELLIGTAVSSVRYVQEQIFESLLVGAVDLHG